MCVLFSSFFFFFFLLSIWSCSMSYQGFPSEIFYLRGHNISIDSYFTGYGVIVAVSCVIDCVGV